MDPCLRDVWGFRTVDRERFCAAAGADAACTVQGNLLNVVKSAPQKAIDFYAFDLFKVISKVIACCFCSHTSPQQQCTCLVHAAIGSCACALTCIAAAATAKDTPATHVKL